MKITHALVKAASVITLTVLSVSPALAGPAYLYGKVPGSRVNVRSGPSTSAPVSHYGLVGDRVQTIDQVVSNDGYAWFYVEFPSGARGWIRGDLLSIQ